jgi:hypothetical protein
MECADNPAPKANEACKFSHPVMNLPQDEALKRGQLALSVYKSDGAPLTAEEIALIKKQIAKFFGPIMVVKAFALLDPAAK